MKWNATSVTAACFAVGLGGFVIGKVTNSPAGSGDSETDALLDRARQVSDSRTTSGDAEGRRDSAGRPIRTGADRTNATLEERLLDMEQIVRSENPLDRSRAMLKWIDSLAPGDFEDAVAYFRNLGVGDSRRGEYAMLLTAWAQVDPTAALAYTTENTSGGMATGTVLSAWANKDPEAAIAWAKSNYDGDGANPYMAGIIRGLAETDLPRATELLAELPYSRERGDALDAMLPHLLSLGADSARDWVSTISDEALRDGAIARLTDSQMAKDDPAGTAEWLMANLGERSSRSVDEVFQELAKIDMNATIAAFEKLPSDNEAARSRGLVAIVQVQARENPTAAVAIMDKYPDSVSDRVVQQFIWSSFDQNPQLAVTQISRMNDGGDQRRMYERTLNAWMDRDQANAVTWINANSANIPEQVVKNLARRNNP
ncbi:MAG: hypothetical protein NWT08_10335 [Akkermansiaceae bacterium]|jgi:hypothetical protein|nr:hypothetical protein [Akkermansiaceae bacterium]MDP4647554.1 hypothetical protein [Akkermansiaceae bacterium]MDP4720713.1 hypothetical protein [Akkermansiaceae bacterium]MDP4779116.1 hypothetical protein [Akkermansiaceae bacterium]MDP4847259.1 hypothetical protein [Akkermansiaceae bacterium]